MKRACLFLLATQLCGCVVYYPYRLSIHHSGRILDEAGTPIPGATVGAVAYTFEPFDRPVAYATVQTGPMGEFDLHLTHRSEAVVSLAGGGTADELCLACKRGYETTYFSCAEKVPVTMRSVSVGRSREEQLKDRRYLPVVRADSYTEYLLSRCDLRDQ